MTFEQILLKLLPFTYIDSATEEIRFSLWSSLYAQQKSALLFKMPDQSTTKNLRSK